MGWPDVTGDAQPLAQEEIPGGTSRSGEAKPLLV